MAFCEFQSYRTLEKPDTKLDNSSIIAVLLFIFGLSLLGSRFVFSPGIAIKIPKVKNIDLQVTSGILNIGINGLIMFNNRILQLKELGEEVANFLSHKKSPEGTTLLVCIDKSVPFGIVIEVSDALKSAGCKNIQIACDS
ncbi:MAG: biopolymer transporter ExbD [Puniceicoccales bacterium]|jgi:biopolymer transport protein ExbD|nr:biopolymer transporter ExbD [Puniceicoccales bacterium]